MKKTHGVLGRLALFASLSFAVGIAPAETTYVLDSELSGTVIDWTKGESYTNGVAPSAELRPSTTVWVPAGMVVRVTDATLPQMTDFARINPLDDAEVVFEIESDGDVNCPIMECYGRKARSKPHPTIRKKGEGRLFLKSVATTASSYDYCADLVVEGGCLVLPQPSAEKNMYYYDIAVSNGAALAISAGNGTWTQGLTGDGVVSNATGGAWNTNQLILERPSGLEPIAFAGRLEGVMRVFSAGGVRQDFTGVESSLTGQLKLAGTVGAVDWGLKGEASSIGTANYLLFHGGTLRHLGDAPIESDKIFEIAATGGGLDGGPYGGVTLTGIIRPQQNVSAQPSFWLTGENTGAVCVANCTITKYSSYPQQLAVYKRGTGTWQIDQTKSHGGIASLTVEGGDLRLETLSDGLSYPRYLGRSGVATTGLVSYVGTSVEIDEAGLYAVDGCGGFRNSGEGQLRYFGLTATDSTGEKTLVLDGSSTKDNEINDITNVAPAVLSVVKRGSGTWLLGGDLEITGDLRVEAGELVIRNDGDRAPFTRFRLQLKENCKNAHPESNKGTYSTLRTMALQAAALYDSEGNRLMTNDVTVCADPLEIGENQIAQGAGTSAWTSGSLATLVSRNSPAWEGSRETGYTQPSVSNPSLWYVLDVRIPEPVRPVSSVDFAPSKDITGSAWAGNLRVFNVLGSRDGVNWTQLYDRDVEIPTNNMRTTSSAIYWGSDKSLCTADNWQAKRTGFPFNVTNSLRTCHVLEQVRSVSVAPNAVLRATGVAGLELDKLTVDAAAGAGEIRNFAFAPSGTLTIENPASLAADGTLPGAYVGCTGSLGDWTVKAGGKTKNWHVKLVDGRLQVVKSGLIIFFR